MAPSHLTPPEQYSKTFCENVHALCNDRMREIEVLVRAIHREVTSKLSLRTLRGILFVFGAPVIAACFALYAFYIQTPLLYAEKEEVNELKTKIAVMETKLGEIPDKVELRKILVEVLYDKENPRDK